MKLSPKMAEIVARMAPGATVRDGMLGDDPRSLPEILDADRATVLDLGLTCEALGERMLELTEAGRRGFGDIVRVEGDLEVQVDSWPGVTPCPFGEPGVHRKEVTSVRNTALGERVRWSELGRHMIEQHGFFQGRGAAWRVEPETLARVLKLVTP